MTYSRYSVSSLLVTAFALDFRGSFISVMFVSLPSMSAAHKAAPTRNPCQLPTSRKEPAAITCVGEGEQNRGERNKLKKGCNSTKPKHGQYNAELFKIVDRRYPLHGPQTGRRMKGMRKCQTRERTSNFRWRQKPYFGCHRYVTGKVWHQNRGYHRGESYAVYGAVFSFNQASRSLLFHFLS